MLNYQANPYSVFSKYGHINQSIPPVRKDFASNMSHLAHAVAVRLIVCRKSISQPLARLEERRRNTKLCEFGPQGVDTASHSVVLGTNPHGPELLVTPRKLQVIPFAATDYRVGKPIDKGHVNVQDGEVGNQWLDHKRCLEERLVFFETSVFGVVDRDGSLPPGGGHEKAGISIPEHVLGRDAADGGVTAAAERIAMTEIMSGKEVDSRVVDE